ncbi:MAG: vitamin K epoxide reductase family protein, partial [Nitrospirota bacterium]
MAKSKRQKQSVDPEAARKTSKTPASLPSGSKTVLDLLLIILAGAGLMLTAYLTYTASFEVHPAFCSEGSGCDIVQSSRWATFLGMPMA